MIHLIVLCGAPGSGKTTVSKQLQKQRDTIRYSFDEMHCFRHIELIPHIKQSLENGNNVVVDSTYAIKMVRTDLLEAIKDINCKRILVFMNTPLDECIRRNAQRKNPLPQYIVEGIYKTIQPPTLDEGWDEILYY